MIHYNEATSPPICRDCSLRPCSKTPTCCKSGWSLKENCCGCTVCAKAEGDHCYRPWGPNSPSIECAPGHKCLDVGPIPPDPICQQGSFGLCSRASICVKRNFTFIEVPKVCDRPTLYPIPSTSSSRPPYY